LREVLTDPSVTPKLADTKALDEVRALQEFYGSFSLVASDAFVMISKRRCLCACRYVANGFGSRGIRLESRLKVRGEHGHCNADDYGRALPVRSIFIRFEVSLLLLLLLLSVLVEMWAAWQSVGCEESEEVCGIGGGREGAGRRSAHLLDAARVGRAYAIAPDSLHFSL
jgi:hypothetical protein